MEFKIKIETPDKNYSEIETIKDCGEVKISDGDLWFKCKDKSVFIPLITIRSIERTDLVKAATMGETGSEE